MSLKLREKDNYIPKEQIDIQEGNNLFDEKEKKVRELIFLLAMMRSQ